ncbi:MAG: spore coat protein CotJB [Firmicutes bacterium]|nr:spore coat protein CotJB [Bacillota bacterium]
MTKEQRKMLLYLQQRGITMDDLREYLDTHPYDAAAIQRYNAAASEYAAAKEKYSVEFTPLCTSSADPSNNEWLWGTSDFPWAE